MVATMQWSVNDRREKVLSVSLLDATAEEMENFTFWDVTNISKNA
jgi:hypothetical protein